MSYDISTKVFARRSAASALAADAEKAREDIQRGIFLHRLDDSSCNVTNYEAEFIESFLTVEATTKEATARWWTDPRRHVVDEMKWKYQTAM